MKYLMVILLLLILATALLCFIVFQGDVYDCKSTTCYKKNDTMRKEFHRDMRKSGYEYLGKGPHGDVWVE